MRSAVEFKTMGAMSCGEISAKLFKHAPEVIYEKNADTFNNIAETADVAREVTHSLPLLAETWKNQRTTINHVTNDLALTNSKDTSYMNRKLN